MPPKDAVVIMARYPRPGMVKTRLASEIGAVKACSLYLSFLKDLAQRFAVSPPTLFWAYTPAGANFASLPWVKAESFPQQGLTLGERMYNVMRRMLDRGFARVIILGSDSPHVPRQRLSQAFTALEDHDIVLGPATDGGYYLVGMHECHDIFSGISWSSPEVLADTVERIRRIGLSMALVEETFDIDELADLEQLRQLLTTDAASLPHTSAVMNAL